MAPSAAWTAAGGVTARAIGYVLFFLAGAALFGVLAVWFRRRHHLRWTSVPPGWPERRCCWGCSWRRPPRSWACRGLLRTRSWS